MKMKSKPIGIMISKGLREVGWHTNSEAAMDLDCSFAKTGLVEIRNPDPSGESGLT